MPEVIDNLRAKLVRHRAYAQEHGEDLPEIGDWRWKRQLKIRRLPDISATRKADSVAPMRCAAPLQVVARNPRYPNVLRSWVPQFRASSVSRTIGRNAPLGL